jgi:hypothetical protein
MLDGKAEAADAVRERRRGILPTTERDDVDLEPCGGRCPSLGRHARIVGEIPVQQHEQA